MKIGSVGTELFRADG